MCTREMIAESGGSPLLLASASPRRRQLLQQIGVEFSVVTHRVNETPHCDEEAREYVVRMALEKARHAASRAGPEQIVLGADTAVVLGDHILGKPSGREEALRTLMALSGRTHEVCSAVAVCGRSFARTRLNVTAVTFRSLSRAEAAAYWRTGEPSDKAGSYGIQGIGALLVSRIEGSYSAVVGLPLVETAALLAEAGIATALDRVDRSE